MKKSVDEKPAFKTVDDGERCRLDLWLVAARFFRHRADALRAIEQGKVLVAGNRAKPARNILVGDELQIEKPNGIYRIKVLERVQIRVSAKIAENFYFEDEESKKNREREQEKIKMMRQMVQFPERKPNKHARDVLREIKRNF
ncbi:MAG: heat-shock protein [Cardiobacteriaceae bacterium]|nr:heat-shock protein [Cardiobacteriaceae bacterium]